MSTKDCYYLAELDACRCRLTMLIIATSIILWTVL